MVMLGDIGVIDWSNSLAGGLQLAFLPGRSSVDLVTGRSLTRSSNVASGNGPFGDNTRSATNSGGGWIVPWEITNPNNHRTWTFLQEQPGLSAAAGGYQFLMDARASGGDYAYYYTSSAGSAPGLLNSDGLIYATGLTAGKSNVLTAVQTPSTTLNYVDGVLNNSRGSWSRGIGSNLRIGTRYTDNDSVCFALYLVLIHNRALSAQEVAALAADPYQLFRQQIQRRTYFVPSVGPITFNPAWASSINGIVCNA